MSLVKTKKKTLFLPPSHIFVFFVAGTSTPSGKQPKNSDPNNGGFATPKRPAPSKADGATSRQNLHRTFLSKSQDNLASQLRRKAVAAALSQKGKDTPGEQTHQLGMCVEVCFTPQINGAVFLCCSLGLYFSEVLWTVSSMFLLKPFST